MENNKEVLINVHNGVKSISYGYFTKEQFEKVTSVFIPSSVTHIDSRAFKDLKLLEKIEVDINNKVYDSRENCNAVIRTDTNELVVACKTSTIPESVTSIGENAFQGCNIINLVIPANIKFIGAGAFTGCEHLRKIIVNHNNKVYDSRKNCNAIIKTDTNELVVACEATEIPSSVKSIGTKAYYKSSFLEEFNIPSTIETIGEEAFSECKYLSSIVIPSTVTSIGAGAFANCENLEDVKVDINNKVYDSRENCNAVIKTDTNELVVACKKTTIPTSVTAIGAKTFIRCEYLTSFEVPSNIISIGEEAFSDCINLETIKLSSNLTSISKRLFSGCKKLNNLVIPSKVTSIEDEAFINCEALEEFDVPIQITKIGNHVFDSCINLNGIYISKNVLEIGNGIVNKCEKLNKIIVDKNNKVYDSRNNCNAVIKTETNELVVACKTSTIPESVTSIGEEAFINNICDCIIIPSSVTSIKDKAFLGCSYLKEIDIPNSVTYIGKSAFEDCTGIKKLILPDNLSTISSHAFAGLSSLTSIKIPDSVTSIKEGAFKECVKLKTIRIPANVNCIEPNIIEGCDKLNGISVVNKNKTFDSREKCNAIINSKTNELVVGCKNTIIPSDVKSIGEKAFAWLDIKSMYIPSSVESIKDNAFIGCKNLKNILYTGSETDWNKVKNSNLLNVNVFYNVNISTDLLKDREKALKELEKYLTEKVINKCGDEGIITKIEGSFFEISFDNRSTIHYEYTSLIDGNLKLKNEILQKEATIIALVVDYSK